MTDLAEGGLGIVGYDLGVILVKVQEDTAA